MRQNKMPVVDRTDARRNTGPEYLARGAMPLALAVMTVLGQAAQAATINVTTINREINEDAFCSLQEAIYAANRDDNKAPDPTDPGVLLTTGCAAGSGADTIYLPAGSVLTATDPIDDYANYLGPTATPIVTSAIVIEGQGARFQRHSLGRYTRAFAVGPGGDLTIHELHVKGFAVHGGNGNDGGGGGMGAGGAIYAYRGSLAIGWSTFDDNSAEGGYGWWNDTIAGGGGGGLSGNGGPASGNFDTGGGGGGSRGHGGSGGAGFGGGGGGTVTSGVGATPGEAGGGPGGVHGDFGAVDGDDGASGGGGGGGTQRIPIFDPFCAGAGGSGGYGGGGGGGGDSGDGGHGGFGGGGGGSGGDGGFGGGGGSKEECTLTDAVGQGGTFAGDGGTFSGGGGAGLGGAIFGHEATIDIENSTFVGNWVLRGLNGGDANDGRGAGGAIFAVGGVLTIDNSTIAGNATYEYNLDPNTGEKVGLGGGGIVVYDPIGDVEATFRLRNTIVAGNDNSECYTRNGVDTAGSEGNLILDSTVNTRNDPPCPGVARSDDPLLGDLALNGPGRTPTMKLGVGSPAIDAAVNNYTADDQRGILRPQGGNGDIGAYEASGLPPTTTITLDPASPNGANGWYVSPVGVTVSATDPDSASVETRCVLNPATTPTEFEDLSAGCAVSSVSADGLQHVIYAASRDENGNTDAAIVSASLKLDATDPTLDPALNVSGPVIVGQAGVTATANAADATSGVASSSCGNVDTSTPGVHTVSCTATDNAGNAASATLTYVVEYRILGFFSPVPFSKWKEGQRVPVKIALGDAVGTRIPSAESAALAQACRVSFEASGAQSQGPDCMKYDAMKDQFVYNWKLDKSDTGTATILVEVSYPGTSEVTQLSVPITITD